MSASPTVVALSGNPRPGSRTHHAARAVADRVADLLGGLDRVDVDLSDLAGEVFDPHSPRVTAATATAAGARVLVVATPTYKATYTGLLKAFLDRYGTAGLAGVVAVPLQVAGHPGHLLAAEVHLRPLLVELGAHVPTRALTLTESQLGDLDAPLEAWVASEGAALVHAAGAAALTGAQV